MQKQVYTFTRVNEIERVQDTVSTLAGSQIIESYLVPEHKYSDFMDTMAKRYGGNQWISLFSCEERLDEEDHLAFEYYRLIDTASLDFEKNLL